MADSNAVEILSLKIECSNEDRMTLVDWRWAAEKGFWNREQQCWIEESGGKAAFLLQRALKRQRNHGVRRVHCISAQVNIFSHLCHLSRF
jgi:hypothetical protein